MSNATLAFALKGLKNPAPLAAVKASKNTSSQPIAPAPRATADASGGAIAGGEVGTEMGSVDSPTAHHKARADHHSRMAKKYPKHTRSYVVHSKLAKHHTSKSS